MSFKIWGRGEIFNEIEIADQLIKVGIMDTISFIRDISKKGCVTVNGTKFLVLKFK